MGTGTFLKESARWKNIIVKIILVLLCPRAHHEADVRQVTRIIVIKLTRARQIIHLKMSTSRIVFPPKENGEPLWTGRFSIRPVNKNSLRHTRREGQSEAPRVSQEWRILIPVGEINTILKIKTPETKLKTWIGGGPKKFRPVLLIIRIDKALTAPRVT